MEELFVEVETNHEAVQRMKEYEDKLRKYQNKEGKGDDDGTEN